VPAGHAALTEDAVLAGGGWHPRYARVLALASDGDYGFAVVDGNCDGAELEAEQWLWDDGAWVAGTSSGTGPLGYLGSLQTGGEFGEARFAYGRTHGRRSVTVSFDGELHEVPVGREGVWAFLKTASGPLTAAPALGPVR
jgi:hypothetical protein